MTSHGASSTRERPVRRRVWLVGASVAAARALGCKRAPGDPVEALLDELEAAAEDRDAERFTARLASGFRGQGRFSREEAGARLRRYFAAYESVGLTVYGVEVDPRPQGPTVRCIVEFSGRARAIGGLQGLLPPSAVYRFTLETAEAGERLEVLGADWRVVDTEGE